MISVIKNYARKDNKLVMETTCYVSIVEKLHPQEAGSVAAIVYEVRLVVITFDIVDCHFSIHIGLETTQTISWPSYKMLRKI